MAAMTKGRCKRPASWLGSMAPHVRKVVVQLGNLTTCRYTTRDLNKSNFGASWCPCPRLHGPSGHYVGAHRCSWAPR